MFIQQLFESSAKRIIVTYPGRFQPFHKGHAEVFANLQRKFGNENVFIVTSNKTDAAKSPFNFSDKVRFMHAMGIQNHNIIETDKVYDIPSRFEPIKDQVVFITVVGAPDARRLNPGATKKDGSPSYFQNVPNNQNEFQTADKHGYVIVEPEHPETITIGGKQYDVSHGTPTRELWNQIRNNPQQRAEFVTQLYGRPDGDLANTLDKIPAGAAPAPAPAAKMKNVKKDLSKVQHDPNAVAESNGYEHGFADPNAPQLGAQGKADFKRQELQHELGHEQNNLAIAINGKTWKVIPGKGYADSFEERSYLKNMQNWAAKKSASSGKKWTVHLTGAPITVDESWLGGYKSVGNWFLKKDGDVIRTVNGEPFTFKSKEEAVKWAMKNYKVSYEKQRIIPTTNPDKNLVVAESNQIERKIHRTQALIQDYYNRSRASKNDIKRDHYIDMARQLEYELEGMINDANQAEQDGYDIAQHDATPSATWNRGGLAEDEKNPFEKGSMGHALWRDLSKTKKASPAQQQRNRERFAKRDAEKAKQQDPLNEFAPDEGGGSRKFIPWPEFLENVKAIVGKDFTATEKVIKSTIQARFIPHDPMEYGPTMLYSYYEARAGRGKGAVSTRGSIQVGKYYPNNTALGKQNFITQFSLLKGHPFERHFDLTFDNVYKIANIIMGNTEGAYQMPQPQQGVAEARANTKAVRTGLSKREKRVDPATDEKKKSEQDAAWERLQAHMNKPENMAVLKRLSTNEQGVAEGSFDNASPMTKDSVKQDRIRSLKNLIAIAKEKGRRLRVQELELELKKLQGLKGGLNEFAPPGSNDGGDDGFSEETLKRLAAQWYNGDEDPRVERTLMAAGWEIGQDEGYDDEPGVFVVQSGDVNGSSYISWPADELRQGMAEGSRGMFSKVMGHETSPVAAKLIQHHGFKKSHTGIFFNVGAQNYSGGGYGGTVIMAKVSGPADGILNLDDDDNLPDDLDELADGEEIANYARSNGYWAWTDGVQFAVLDPNHIQIVKQGVAEGDVVQFPKKHKGDLEGFDDCPKCGRDLMGGTYMGLRVKVCNPCKQVYLPPNSGIDQKGNKIDEGWKEKAAAAALAAGTAMVPGTSHGIAGAFPTPSAQQAMYKAAADSNRAMAAQEVERQRRENAAKAAKLAADTKDVERLNKVNYHGADAPKPSNADWDGDSDFLDLDGTQYAKASRMPISGDVPSDMKLVATKQGRQVYLWTRRSLKGIQGHYFYPAEKPNTIQEKSVSKAQFRTMAAAAHNPEFAKKVGIEQGVAKEFHAADKGQSYKSLPKRVTENAEELNIGDPVIITGDVNFHGKTGDIDSFGDMKRFVVVNLYNHGKHSFHSSDVSYNDYADQEDDEDYYALPMPHGDRDLDEDMYQYDAQDPYNSEFAPQAGMGRMTLRGWKQQLIKRTAELAQQMAAAGQDIDKSALWDNVYKKLKSMNMDPIAQEIEQAQAELERIRQRGGVRSRAFKK